MYETKTYEDILQQMLDRVPEGMDKREGSIIYDALAPAAAELAILYIELDVILNQTFADTATGEYLEKRCAERGLTRKEATYAVVKGIFTPSTVDVIGQRFRCGDIYYTVNDDGTLTCETPGTTPNGVTGQLIPVNYIDGLVSASISQVLIPGEDEETDEKLRKRYYENIDSQAFGGNITDYKEKTNDIDGVGGVKVTPVWNGGGTVLLTIITNDYSVPSSTLISNVQTQIDDIAPIGHIVTVKGVNGVNIDINTQITYQDGWNWSSADDYIKTAIDDYFKSLAETWEDESNLVVRISGIEQKILACSGVIDVQNTTLNGVASNIQLGVDEIPIRGGVSDGS